MDHPLYNRLKKRFKHLNKWAKRQGITCFRVYERDLSEYPMIIDWINGDVLMWIYDDVVAAEVSDIVFSAFDIDENRLFEKSRGKQTGLQSQYQKVNQKKDIKIVEEGGLKFELNLSDYLDVGLFLDHRQTREICRGMCRDKRFLNLFAYTGSFTCYAISGGASSTTTVDLNANYLDWASRNLELNGFKKRPSDRLVKDNCMAFLKHEISHQSYDVIVCDPPTFSNSKSMKTSFNVDDDYVGLVKDCIKLLAPGGVILFSTNSRKFKFDRSRFGDRLMIKNISTQTIPPDFSNSKIHQVWQIKKEA